MREKKRGEEREDERGSEKEKRERVSVRKEWSEHEKEGVAKQRGTTTTISTHTKRIKEKGALEKKLKGKGGKEGKGLNK